MLNLKRLFVFILMCLSITRLNAQKLSYFQGTLEEAKAAAKKQHKLIYLMVEMGDNTVPYSPIPLDEELLKKYNSGFICIYKNARPKAGLDGIYQQYNISTYPTHLFLDGEGNLILKTVGYRSRKEPYLADITKAIQLSKGKSLSQYAEEYKKGSRSEQFLRNYLLKYDDLDIPVNQNVLEAYASILPVHKLDDYETIAFLIQRAPVLSSMAYKITRVNPKLTDSLYKVLPYDKRVKINNRIIRASLALAKMNKDEKLAMQTAAFTQATWTNNWQKGMAAHAYNMMDYYKAVNDTAKYLRNASNYYQQYYQMLRDSIHKTEWKSATVSMPAPVPPKAISSAAMTALPDKNDLKKDSAMIVNKTIRITTVALSANATSGLTQNSDARAMEYAMTLNNGAWSFYTMRTSNATYLAQAVIWVLRSIELFPENSAYYDTLAHLYYLQKKYEDAINIQQKAIEVSRSESKKVEEMMLKRDAKPSTAMLEAFAKSAATLTKELEKMKQRSL
jgi:tetratricopeptide (TPR) repeat protein